MTSIKPCVNHDFLVCPIRLCNVLIILVHWLSIFYSSTFLLCWQQLMPISFSLKTMCSPPQKKKPPAPRPQLSLSACCRINGGEFFFFSKVRLCLWMTYFHELRFFFLPKVISAKKNCLITRHFRFPIGENRCPNLKVHMYMLWMIQVYPLTGLINTIAANCLSRGDL